jgi:hypothetical protein
VDRQRALVPTVIPRPDRSPGAHPIRPELEFIFRTLVELRVDMDQLKRDFDEYRMHPGSAGLLGRVERRFPAWQAPDLEEDLPQTAEVVEPGEPGEPPRMNGAGGAGGTEPPPPPEGAEETRGVVVYRPGMSMEDMEREAIRAALQEVGGNRRRAAERLGIGERTLYRKIQRFGLES